jgi:hypothetical protein
MNWFQEKHSFSDTLTFIGAPARIKYYLQSFIKYNRSFILSLS